MGVVTKWVEYVVHDSRGCIVLEYSMTKLILTLPEIDRHRDACYDAVYATRE